MNALQELVDMKEAYQKELMAKGEAAITSTFKELFENNEKLESIEIRGYVPYFNDGDACVFGMGYPTVTYNGEEHDGAYSVKYDLEKGKITSEDAAKATAVFDKLEEMEQLEDAFQQIFGDHFIITATKDGVEVEEYRDHD
jgi:hypothetical protein